MQAAASLAVYILAWGISFVAVRGLGMESAVPVAFGPVLALTVLPGAWLAAIALPDLAAHWQASRSPLLSRLLPWLAVPVLLFALHWWWLPPLLMVLHLSLRRHTLSMFQPLRWAPLLALMALGYGVVWNANYLLAKLVDRRVDAELLSFDFAIYSFFAGGPVVADGLYPLSTMNWWNALLENAYAALFVEILAVLLWLSPRCNMAQLTRIIHGLFVCYAMGCLGFLLAPAIGPHLFVPSALRLDEFSATSRLMLDGMLHEYNAVRGSGHLQGFAYFIAVPSLHVAASTFLQFSLPPGSFLRRLFLPLNLLLSSSTVLLGYHYLLDIPSGWLTGYAAAKLVAWLSSPQAKSSVVAEGTKLSQPI
jgi:membrane-associated phospholipid phosphatase